MARAREAEAKLAAVQAQAARYKGRLARLEARSEGLLEAQSKLVQAETRAKQYKVLLLCETRDAISMLLLHKNFSNPNERFTEDVWVFAACVDLEIFYRCMRVSGVFLCRFSNVVFCLEPCVQGIQ